MKDSLVQLFNRDIEKLKTEISSYKNEGNLWKISGDIKNSGGNLCLHLCGNLQHFIGAVLGSSGYERNRDAEFSRKDIPQKDLLMEIDETKNIVNKTLNSLNEETLQQIYPVNKYGEEMTTGYFLLHLFGHLSYHLGQINYQRRMIDS
jgi:uncharacterized damage-inducible protein DinB